MQHHNAPTRLLDWTDSAFVAAYFAVERDLQDDGAIWALDCMALSDKVKRAHFRDRFPPPEEHGIRFLNPNAAPAVWSIQRPLATDRIVAQQGVFTIAEHILTDHGHRIEELAAGDDDMFFRFVIPAHVKRLFLRRLRRMNIHAGALFPGIDGLGRSVAEIVHLIGEVP